MGYFIEISQVRLNQFSKVHIQSVIFFHIPYFLNPWAVPYPLDLPVRILITTVSTPLEFFFSKLLFLKPHRMTLPLVCECIYIFCAIHNSGIWSLDKHPIRKTISTMMKLRMTFPVLQLEEMKHGWAGLRSLVRGYRRVCGRAVKSGSGYQASVHIWWAAFSLMSI